MSRYTTNKFESELSSVLPANDDGAVSSVPKPNYQSPPKDHPIFAYIDDASALIEILYDEPELLEECRELDFLKRAITYFSNVPPTSKKRQDGALTAEATTSIMNTHTEEELNQDDTNNEGDALSEGESYWSEEDEEITDTNTHVRAIESSESDFDMQQDEECKVNQFTETFECVIVGAGAAGIGVGISLVCGGMKRKNMLIIDKSNVGSSFDSWNECTRFISPSWFSNPYGPVDLNAIDPFSSVAVSGDNDGKFGDDSQHPSGARYARYLRQRSSEWKLPIRENCDVAQIDKVLGTDAWKAGGFKIEVREGSNKKNPARSEEEKIHHTIYSRYVIWCGGEWSYPKFPTALDSPFGERFQLGSYIHYSEMGNTNLWKDMVKRAKANQVPIFQPKISKVQNESQGIVKKSPVAIIIGAYEAGIDTACEMLDLGMEQIILVDSENYIQGWIGCGHSSSNDEYIPSVDPSVSLAPVSIKRLKAAYETGKVTILPSQNCIETSMIEQRFYAKITSKLKEKQSSSPITLCASLPIIFCTGFDPSQASPMADLTRRNPITNGPELSQSCDESLKTSGFFVCGPMVRHVLESSLDNCESNIPGVTHGCINSYFSNDIDDISSISNPSLQNDVTEIIFCFVYKFRTRFALVAGEILSRLIYEDHCHTNISTSQSHQNKIKNLPSQKNTVTIIDKTGHQRLGKVEQMMRLYKENGMLQSTLRCSLSCKSPIPKK